MDSLLSDYKEIDQRINHALNDCWKDIFQDKDELSDIKQDILLNVWNAIKEGGNVNIDKYVLRLRHKYYEYKKKDKLIYEHIKRAAQQIIPSYDVFSSIIDSSSSFEQRLRNFWKEIPELGFTPKQEKIFLDYREYMDKKETDWGFETYFAGKKGISQGAVSKQFSIVKKKFGISIILSSDDFDLSKFFSIFCKDWVESALRERIWPLLKPGKHRNEKLVNRLLPFQDQMLDFAAQKLLNFSSAYNASPQKFYEAYHALILATLIEPNNAKPTILELEKKVAPKGWLVERVIARATHLLNDESEWEKYRDWLLKCLLDSRKSTDKDTFIVYAAAYFGSFEKVKRENFICNLGRYLPRNFDISKIIKEHYQNISETLYRRSPILIDINFLRLYLFISSLQSFNLPKSCISCLRQICRRTMDMGAHTIVRNLANNVLKKLKKTA